MSLKTLVAKLTGRRKARIENYGQLVGRVADQEDLDDADADSILLAAGKAPEDLERDSALLVKRRGLAGKLATAPQVASELATIENKQRELAAELEAATQRHAAAVQPLQQRALHLRQVLVVELGSAQEE